MHDLYVVGIPTFVVLIGILLNQHGFERQDARMDKIESRLDKMQSDLTARIDRIQSDLSQFYRALVSMRAN